MIKRIKSARQTSNKLNVNGSINGHSSSVSPPSGMGAQSEIEALQNALQDAMTRERQLITDQVQKDEERKQERDAQKLYIAMIMKEKKELEERMAEMEQKSNSKMSELSAADNPPSQSPPSQPPPSAPPSISPMEVEELKNEALRNKEDLTRVLGKLSQREHEHNQLNEQIMRLRSELKERTEEHDRFKARTEELEKTCRLKSDKLDEAQLKMDRATKDTERFHHQQTLLQSITNDYKEQTERTKILEQEKENLRDELNEKKQVIEDLHGKMELATLQSTKQSATITELQLRMEDLQSKGKEQIDQLIAENEELKQSAAEMEERVSLSEKRLEDETKSFEDRMDEMKMEVEAFNEERSRLIEEHRAEMEAKDERVHEMELQSKIKEKKKAKMIKELQEQVKREMIKSQEQKCQTLRLSDEMESLKAKNEALMQSAESQKRSPSSGGSGKHLDLQSLHHQSPNGKSSPSVEREVSKELARKLEAEVKTSFAYKSQVKYLTETVQQLHIDLGNKKTVIETLTKSIDAAEHSDVTSLLEETALQNSMLRDQLKTMGQQLMDSHSKLDQLRQSK